MALSHRKLIGTWKNVPGSVFQAMTFDNGTTFYLAQILKEYPLSFYIRGGGLAENTNDFQLASGVTPEDLAQLVDSDSYGTAKPNGFKTPAGYVEKYATDGTAFFVNAEEQRQADLGGDSDGDGVPDTRSANLFTQVTDWVKANPVLAIGIAVAVYLFILKPMMGGGKGKKKGLLALL